MAEELFEKWADEVLQGARLPSTVVHCALLRANVPVVPQAAKYRLDQFTLAQMREAVPMLIMILKDETGLRECEPGWQYDDSSIGPWSEEPSRTFCDPSVLGILSAPRLLYPARYDLTLDEGREALRRSGAKNPNDPHVLMDYVAGGSANGAGGPAAGACRHLGRIGDPRAVPMLAAVFASPDIRWEVRREAGRGLNAIDSREVDLAAPTCLAMARSHNRDGHSLRLQWQAVRLLRKIGSPLGIPVIADLVRMLETSRAWILPPLAALALGGIGTPEARESLERIIRELVPGSPLWEERDSTDRPLILAAARAGLGLGAVPEVPDPE
jgi:HEAT repeat protein